MNNVALATALFTEPARAFDVLAEKPRWAFPFWLVLFATVGLTIWYYAKVDLIWLNDIVLRANPRVAALPEEDQARLIASSASPGFAAIGVLGILVMVVLMRVLEATWYSLAGKVTNVERSYRQWFALACWTGLPQVIAVLAAVPILATITTTQIDNSVIAPLSLNELFFHRKLGEPGQGFLAYINLLHFVGAGLAVYGVKLWSRRSWLFASLFVLVPPVLIFGIWGYIALGRS